MIVVKFGGFNMSKYNSNWLYSQIGNEVEFSLPDNNQKIFDFGNDQLGELSFEVSNGEITERQAEIIRATIDSIVFFASFGCKFVKKKRNSKYNLNAGPISFETYDKLHDVYHGHYYVAIQFSSNLACIDVDDNNQFESFCKENNLKLTAYLKGENGKAHYLVQLPKGEIFKKKLAKGIELFSSSTPEKALRTSGATNKEDDGKITYKIADNFYINKIDESYYHLFIENKVISENKTNNFMSLEQLKIFLSLIPTDKFEDFDYTSRLGSLHALRRLAGTSDKVTEAIRNWFRPYYKNREGEGDPCDVDVETFVQKIEGLDNSSDYDKIENSIGQKKQDIALLSLLQERHGVPVSAKVRKARNNKIAYLIRECHLRDKSRSDKPSNHVAMDTTNGLHIINIHDPDKSASAKSKNESWPEFRNPYATHGSIISQLIDDGELKKVNGITFNINTDNSIVEETKDEGKYSYLNTWRPKYFPSAENLEDKWQNENLEFQAMDVILDYIKFCICNNDEGLYQYLLSMLAFHRQCPGTKMKQAILAIGEQRSGKSTFGEMLLMLYTLYEYGDVKLAKYGKKLDPEGLLDANKKEFVSPQLVYIIEDLEPSTDASAKKLHSLTLTLITEHTIRARGLYKDGVLVPNPSLLYATSNHYQPLNIPGHDERWLIIDIPSFINTDEELTKTFGKKYGIKSKAEWWSLVYKALRLGKKQLLTYFDNFKIESLVYRPHGPAYVTESKKEMIDNNAQSLDHFDILRDFFNKETGITVFRYHEDDNQMVINMTDFQKRAIAYVEANGYPKPSGKDIRLFITNWKRQALKLSRVRILPQPFIDSIETEILGPRFSFKIPYDYNFKTFNIYKINNNEDAVTDFITKFIDDYTQTLAEELAESETDKKLVISKRPVNYKPVSLYSSNDIAVITSRRNTFQSLRLNKYGDPAIILPFEKDDRIFSKNSLDFTIS